MGVTIKAPADHERMTDASRRFLETAATHEAGHVVVGTLLGLRIVCATAMEAPVRRDGRINFVATTQFHGSDINRFINRFTAGSASRRDVSSDFATHEAAWYKTSYCQGVAATLAAASFDGAEGYGIDSTDAANIGGLLSSSRANDDTLSNNVRCNFYPTYNQPTVKSKDKNGNPS